jgi:hypothetical protein
LPRLPGSVGGTLGLPLASTPNSLRQLGQYHLARRAGRSSGVMLTHSRWNHSVSHCTRLVQVNKENEQTHIVVTGDHSSFTDTIAYAVARLIGVDVIHFFLFHRLDIFLALLCLLLALGAFTTSNRLLTTLCNANLALRWRFPTGTRTQGGRCCWKSGLAEDTMTSVLAGWSACQFGIGLLALCFGCWNVTSG